MSFLSKDLCRKHATGPIVSFALSLLFGLLGQCVTDMSERGQALGQWLSRIKLNLALFNLTLGFLLAGGRVFRALMWKWTGDFIRATRIASNVGKGIAFIFIAGGFVIVLNGALFQGLWLTFIGRFLLSAAETSTRQAALTQALAGLHARDVMTTDCPKVPDYVSLSQLVGVYPIDRTALLSRDDRQSVTRPDHRPSSETCSSSRLASHARSPSDGAGSQTPQRFT